MTDTFSPAQRSRIMALVKSRGNVSTEVRFVLILRARRITGWRRNTDLPGKPDVVFPAHRLAVFLDGCFWHGCPRCRKVPSSNKIYWRAKVARNRRRDREMSRVLRERGWRVLRIWEHSLRAGGGRAVSRLVALLSRPGSAK